jgi:hypothetical protein
MLSSCHCNHCDLNTFIRQVYLGLAFGADNAGWLKLTDSSV